MKISLTGTDHHNSKPSKVIQFERKQSLNFLKFEKICKRTIAKTTFLVYSGPLKVNFRLNIRLLTSQYFFLTLITVSFICSIVFHIYFPYHISVFTIFSFFRFYFIFLFLVCSPRDIFSTKFNSISLQPTFNCLISLQYTIQKTYTKLQTFLNEERNEEKELL